ncbi:uncharacterized protein LOC127585870 isoform X2 [Pristis pectinata]|uniref:uncharacterized protein LOC127585870 isoform X2 n=1 Tax=Pristis pectinata TaxID=685728 RepID=UPI00223DA7C0|nr:uncharacterized protein LOC127585870 isoform X2 [Pristis pectinata]
MPLLDAFVKIHMSHASPSQSELEASCVEEGVVTRTALGKGDAARDAGPFWPPAAIGKARRLAGRTPPWKRSRPEEPKPKGRRSRSDRSARHGAGGSSPVLPKVGSDGAGQAGEWVPLARLPLPLEEASRDTLRRQRHQIFIGDQRARWNSLRARLDVRSDEEMAKILLDVFIENQMNQPGPSCTFLQAGGPDERAAFTCDAVTEQDDLDSFPSLSLSAGSESTVTLSHPSSIDSFEEDADADLCSGTDSPSGSSTRFPPAARRRPRPLLINHETRPEKEEGEWELSSENHRFKHCGWSSRESDLRNKGMDSTDSWKPPPKGLERQHSSDREIITVCIGEGGVPTCPAIKKEQEESCSLPSPPASAFSGTTVTLSHPSSDISLEEECLANTTVASESETEGMETVTNRRKRPALPDEDSKDSNVRWGRPGLIDVGAEIDRWNFVKACLKLKTDEEMAGALLDLYMKTHTSPPCPLTPLPVFVKKV